MRLTTKLTTAAAAFTLATAAIPSPARATSAPVVASVAAVAAPSSIIATRAMLPQDQGVKIELETNDGGGAWYTQPVWIAIGVIALVLLVVLISMAGRRDRTTIVK